MTDVLGEFTAGSEVQGPTARQVDQSIEETEGERRDELRREIVVMGGQVLERVAAINPQTRGNRRYEYRLNGDKGWARVWKLEVGKGGINQVVYLPEVKVLVREGHTSGDTSAAATMNGALFMTEFPGGDEYLRVVAIDGEQRQYELFPGAGTDGELARRRGARPAECLPVDSHNYVRLGDEREVRVSHVPLHYRTPVETMEEVRASLQKQLGVDRPRPAISGPAENPEKLI